MSIQYQVTKESYKNLICLLQKCGTVVSILIKPKLAMPPSPDLVLRSISAIDPDSDLGTQVSELGCINSRPLQFSLLNRLEFEGSISAVVKEGGCNIKTEGIPLKTIKDAVCDGVSAVFPEPFSEVNAYRIDDTTWCDLTNSSTTSASYMVFEGARGLWWILCVADID